jgi:hypothetical protein
VPLFEGDFREHDELVAADDVHQDVQGPVALLGLQNRRLPLVLRGDLQ